METEKTLDLNGSETPLSELSEPAPQQAPAEPPRTATGLLWFLVVLSTLSSTFLYALDNTITATVQPAIVAQFGSLDKISWISVAFLLGAAGTNLFWGNFYSVFSAKWAYIGTVLLFMVGSALCGTAPNMDALIVGRAICGFGGAGMYTGVLTLLSVQTTEKERPLYMGLTGITWGAGTVLGPIIGGALTDSSATWRWAFYLNLVVGAVFTPCYLFLLPKKDPCPGDSLVTRISKIDWIGSALICATLISILMAISFGGALYAWNSSQVIALFVVFGVLLGTFIVQQVTCLGTDVDHRLFPINFVKSRTMVTLFILTAAAGSCTFIPLYFIPLYFQFVRLDTAFDAGVRLLPFVAFMVVFCVGQGHVVGATGYYVPWYIFAGICDTAGSALLFTVDETTSLAKVYGYSILLGAGAGATIQAAFAVAQVKNPPRMIPQAIGFCTTAQLSGPALALGIANAVFVNRATDSIQALVPEVSRVQIQGALATGIASLHPSSATPDFDSLAVHLVVKALDKAFVISLVAGAMTLLLSFTMKPNDRLFAGK